MISADESLGLVFLATGNAAADQWGGNRRPEEDRFTDAVVALDLATGQLLRPVVQRPVPQGPAPGDWVSPTQPQSVFYPNIGGVPGLQRAISRTSASPSMPTARAS